MGQRLFWRLVTDQDPVARAIRFVTRGRVSHMEFMSADGVTATGARANGGVAARPAGYAKFSLDIRYSVWCEDQQYELAMNFLRAQIGKPYDFTAIGSILFARNWRDPAKWFCSELWAATMEQAGLIGRIEDAVNKFTPQDGLILSSAMFGQAFYAVGNRTMMKRTDVHV